MPCMVRYASGDKTMKLSYKQIEPFVKSPDKAARVILVYGPDAGLARERAKVMGLTVVADLADPFNVATFTGGTLADDPARLSDEANAVSMMGGDRLVRVEQASDKITPIIKDYLENPSGQTLVILEAGELGPRSSLRKLCESAKNAAAVPCYVEDERDIARLIRDTMQQAGLQIDRDAVDVLAANIGGDRGKVRSELEKLVLYKGRDTGAVNIEDVQNCCGQIGAIDLDDLVYNVAGRQAERALKNYNQLLSEGINFIVIVRALQTHFRKLHLARTHFDEGGSVDLALRSIKPPIFFKQQPAFKTQIQQWPLKTLNIVLMKLVDLEADCKKTDCPVETLCGQTILGISAMRRG